MQLDLFSCMGRLHGTQRVMPNERLLYLRQREHTLDLIHQLRTYALMQERGVSKKEASAETGYGLNRDYGVGAQILHELGLRRILLLTNHPPKVAALEGFELEVVGNVPLGSPASEERTDNTEYVHRPKYAHGRDAERADEAQRNSR